MLSAHPLSHIVSLHHVDRVNSIFPKVTQTQPLKHLFKAINVNPTKSANGFDTVHYLKVVLFLNS